MSKSKRSIGFVLCALLFSATLLAQTPTLLIYCGITMVRPVTELSRKFETRENIRIQIAQGGSEDLYQSAKRSHLGDIYFPGEPSYRDKHFAEGLFGEATLVGYNQMALIVRKGNPKQVKGDLQQLLRKDLTLLVGNAESGSVGQETRAMLEKMGLYHKVVARAVQLMPDSRSINLALRRGEADVALNWRATSFFPDNAADLQAVDLDPKVAPPQALLLIPLNFSKNAALAQKFIRYAATEEGQAVFRKHGFVDSRGVR